MQCDYIFPIFLAQIAIYQDFTKIRPYILVDLTAFFVRLLFGKEGISTKIVQIFLQSLLFGGFNAKFAFYIKEKKTNKIAIRLNKKQINLPLEKLSKQWR